MNHGAVSGHFLQSGKGPIFVLLREPKARTQACVLVVPPFAEEMNKSRRMVTEVALGLAERGVATVLPDLYGTGDSAGDFADGDWTCWQDDIHEVCRWSAERGRPVTEILAVRLGCALAAACVSAGTIGPIGRTVLWQPVFDGPRFLGQFLRLRVAASLMEQDRKETLAELRSRLHAGETLEVAGYRLSGRLASDLDAVLPPDLLPIQLGDVAWMETVREVGASIPAASARLIDQTRAAGGRIETHAIAGEPFWAATEIVRNTAMVEATIRALSEAPNSVEGPTPQ